MSNAIASGSSGAQASRPCVRESLWVILATVAVLAVCLPLITWTYLLRTDYAPGFSKTEFDQLSPGDTLEDVLAPLKAPVNFAIVSQRQDDSRYQPQYSDDGSMLWKWANDETVVLILRYSRPRDPGGDYRAREVWIRNGVVQETRAYNYWD